MNKGDETVRPTTPKENTECIKDAIDVIRECINRFEMSVGDVCDYPEDIEVNENNVELTLTLDNKLDDVDVLSPDETYDEYRFDVKLVVTGWKETKEYDIEWEENYPSTIKDWEDLVK